MSSAKQDAANQRAFEEGQQAWREGKNLAGDNPYPPASPYHDYWEQGWESEDEIHRKCDLMPRGPKGEKCPADVIGNAVKVMRIAVGEEADEAPPDDGKNKAAQELGRLGGKARAISVSADMRRETARRAAQAKWSKKD